MNLGLAITDCGFARPEILQARENLSIRNAQFEIRLQMGHSERELIFDRTRRTLQAAGAAVPALRRVADNGFFLPLCPVKDVSGTDVVAVPTPFTFLVDDGWHGLPPESLPASLWQREETKIAVC